MRRVLPAPLTPAAAVFLALLPQAVEAHAGLVSSSPASGQRLATAPGQVTLLFSEPINPQLSSATVTAPDAHVFRATGFTSDSMQISLSTNLPGVYTVSWSTVSAVDGHYLNGEFRFGVGLSVVNPAANQGLPAGGLWLVGARAAELVALLAALGGLVLRALARRPPELRSVRAEVALPLSVALIAGIAVVTAESVAAVGPAPDLWAAYLTGGLSGYARLVRLGLEASALAAWAVRPRVTVIPLLGAVVALSLSGHAAANPDLWFSVPLDSAHVLSAGAWAGGILALALIRPGGGWTDSDGRTLLRRFAPVALVGFGLTVVTGALQGLQNLSGFGDLFHTAYGLVLDAKVVLVAAMLALSWLAFRQLRPAPRVEGLVAVGVVVATGLLAAYPLPPARAAALAAEQDSPEAVRALPEPGDLTFGASAGDVLVGITLRKEVHGGDRLWLYVMPPAGATAAGSLTVSVAVDDHRLPIRRCGLTCRTSLEPLSNPPSTLRISLAGTQGGVAELDLRGTSSVTDGGALASLVQRRMHSLHSLRVLETLGPARPPVRTQYLLQAPDRLQLTSSTGFQEVIVGPMRYSRTQASQPWQPEPTAPVRQPSYMWDFGPIANSWILPTGAGQKHLVFFEESYGTPAWFELSVEQDGTVARAQMWAQSHFMNDLFSDLDAVQVEPPLARRVPSDRFPLLLSPADERYLQRREGHGGGASARGWPSRVRAAPPAGGDGANRGLACGALARRVSTGADAAVHD